MTVKVRPAIVRVPVRGTFPDKDATRNLTVPSPLPLAPDRMVNHPSLLVAVHAHPSGADTSMVGPSPPSRPIVANIGLIE